MPEDREKNTTWDDEALKVLMIVKVVVDDGGVVAIRKNWFDYDYDCMWKQ